jgi:TonB family protein
MRWLALFSITLASGIAQQSGPYRIGGGVTAPTLIYKVEPVYSDEARQAALGGTVRLVVIVDEDGKPKDFKVKRSLGLGLDEAAIEAVKQWLFRPGMKEGKPVSVQAYIDVNFRLLAGLNGWHRSDISYKPQEGASNPLLVKEKYPPNAAPGSAASITLSFDVDEQGVPINLHAEKSSDQKWEAEIMTAVREWRFDPGLLDGKAVLVPCTVNFILSGMPAPATSGQAAASQPIDPSKMAAIEALFTVSKADRLIRQVVSQVQTAATAQIEKSVADVIPESGNRSKILGEVQDFEKQVFAVITARLDFQQMKPELIRIYDETLTRDELISMVDFYKSPAGQAILEKLPTLTAKSVAMAQQMMRDTMPEIQRMTSAWKESMKTKYGDLSK